MPTRNVVITEHQAALVEQLVASGRFQNASEVLRYGLRLVEQREAEEAAKLKALLAAVEEGEAAVVAGRYSVIETEEELDAFVRSLDEP